jgi:epoxide hydrolase-like predicted phosphatase
MIKALIFDIGGVIIRTEDPGPRRALEQQWGLAAGEAEFLVYNSDAGRQAQLGALRAADHWLAIGDRFGLDADGIAAFKRAFWGGDRVDHELLALIRTLHARYQTAIISNAMDDLLDEVVPRLDPQGDLFDVVVGSAYERIMKPDRAIYERTLARLGRQPQEAIFIDDNAANIAGAEAVGLSVIHYRPGLDLRAALATFGVTA